MKQFYLLTKTLLVAVCLLGGANSAWGDDLPTPVYSQDFESATTEVGSAGSNFGITGATLIGSGSIQTGDALFGKYFLNTKSNTNRANYLKIATNAFQTASIATNKAITISFWVKTNGQNYGWNSVFNAFTDEGFTATSQATDYIDGYGAFIIRANTSSHAKFTDYEYHNTWDSSPTYSDNYTWGTAGWHHIAYVLYDDNSNTHLNFYIDGTLNTNVNLAQSGTGTLWGNLSSLTNYVLGGCSGLWFDGDVDFGFDEIAIYDQALTAGNICRVIAKKKGLTEETYDFTTNSTKSSSTSAWGEIVNSSYYILSNSYVDMKGRFAGGKYSSGGSGGWTIMANNVGMQNTNSNSSKGFCILNLSEGDYIVINYDTQGTYNITFSSGNIAGEESGTVVVSGEAYKISSAGYLLLNFARYATVQSIEIHTSTPVLSAPNGKVFNSMVESGGLYYPKYTFTSSDDGVTFYDGDGNDITSGYTFMTTDPVTVYAGKTGRTNSAKTTYTVTDKQVGMILAYSVEDGDLVGTINYGTGAVLADAAGIGGATWVIPGLDFSGTNITYRTWGILPTSGNRSVICNVLNDNRVATYEHYDYVSKTTGYDYLTSTNNSATLKRQDKDNYDRLYAYALYVSPSEEVSVTIGSTGYSTFSSPVPLNFAGIDGLTAFVATTVADGAVKLSPVTTAPANTGLVLKGTAGASYNIPVTNSAATPASNLLVGCIVNTTVAADATSGFNNYVLVNEGGIAEFQSLVDFGATVTAGKAFLKNGAVSSPARLSIVFEDDATAIKTVDAAAKSGAQADGKYLEKGKIVIVKNGTKFNANGQRMK